MLTVASSESVKLDIKPMSRSERLTVFYGYLDAADKLLEATRKIGVSYQTGVRWKRDRRSKNEAKCRRILTKLQAEHILTTIAESKEQTGAYRINAINKLGELEGWNAPTHSVHTDTAQLALVDWLDRVYEARQIGTSASGALPIMLAKATHVVQAVESSVVTGEGHS